MSSDVKWGCKRSEGLIIPGNETAFKKISKPLFKYIWKFFKRFHAIKYSNYEKKICFNLV